MNILKTVVYYILGIFGILCISVMPKRFMEAQLPETGGIFHIGEYVKTLWHFIIEFSNPESWVYMYGRPPKPFPLLETIWEPFVYSMQIVIGALFAGFFLALLLALFANFLPKPILHPLKRLLEFLESIPDLVVAILLQMLVIWIYQATDIRLFNVATYMDQKVYAGPIITLAILPMVTLFKFLLHLMEEERLRDYVVFAKSKGMKERVIVLHHILKNIAPSAFHHSKVIVWGTLSSLFIIERIFNINGITFYMTESLQPMVIAISLILLFTPFFLFFQGIDFWLRDEGIYGQTMVKKDSGNRKRIQPIRSLVHGLKQIGQSILQIRKPWNVILKPLKLFFTHMKNPKFAIGCLFFVVTITCSVLYSVVTDDHIDQTRLYFAEDGVTLISAPPHSPPEPYLMGTDALGFSIFDQLVVGAKYTLFFALLIALLRVGTGFFIGIFYAFTLNTRGQKWIEKIVDSIHFLPLSVIAYILLEPILMESSTGFQYSFSERMLLEIVILTILVVPLTAVLSGKEMKGVLQQEFIVSAKVLGGSKFHILKKHILPHIGPRLTILFGQQFIQVLLIFMHLGVFDFYFGGTNISFERIPDPPQSITYEWSGLLGAAKESLSGGQYWLIIFTLFAFMLAIFAMQLMIQGVKEVQQVKVGVIFKRKKKRVRNERKDISGRKDVQKLQAHDFHLVRRYDDFN
ncbi:peptide/nickel transport system permease protein [Salinibacillus kushneri]|uniref:Peptide/nickel transport system permease protein n=1 Tax=Salinibacillus kushneri TaxID=237682 RepID=A0A1I0CT87_9BACI|nr:ABC transporter permease subunit [Salinibacillus kushneri]SET22812.1 peptide/nickel transport system permease protein [Salinibacillus kushneri]